MKPGDCPQQDSPLFETQAAMPRAVEEYLKPEVVRQIARLDLRAQFIVRGFLQGLHASPYQGFSVEFSEYRNTRRVTIPAISTGGSTPEPTATM